MASPQYSSPTFFGGFLAGVLFIFIIGVATDRDIRYMGGAYSPQSASRTDIDESASEHQTGMPAGLKVIDQPSGNVVNVDSVEFSVPGWVVVHETEAGHVLNALGAARADAGAHTNVAVELLRATEPGGSYAVILYSDNGNKEFEVRGDLPIIDTNGDPVMQTFRTFGGAAAY